MKYNSELHSQRLKIREKINHPLRLTSARYHVNKDITESADLVNTVQLNSDLRVKILTAD